MFGKTVKNTAFGNKTRKTTRETNGKRFKTLFFLTFYKFVVVFVMFPNVFKLFSTITSFHFPSKTLQKVKGNPGKAVSGSEIAQNPNLKSPNQHFCVLGNQNNIRKLMFKPEDQLNTLQHQKQIISLLIIYYVLFLQFPLMSNP